MIQTAIHSENGYPIDRQDEVLAREAAELLHRHYPNHMWAVFVNSTKTGGVMVIKNLMISSLYGYVLHLKNVYADPTLKSVLKAGGEILERANLRRGANRFDLPKWIDGIPAKRQPLHVIRQQWEAQRRAPPPTNKPTGLILPPGVKR